MLITDLEHLEIASHEEIVVGGEMIDPRLLIGKAIAMFAFDSLSTGAYGAFGSGVPNILTTAFPGVSITAPGQYSVGFKFTYSSIAIGLPLELAAG